MKLYKNWLFMSLLAFGGIVLPLHAAEGTLVEVMVEALSTEEQEPKDQEEEEVKEQEFEQKPEYEERPSLYNRKALLAFLKKKQEGSKRTQLLTIFLDEEEVGSQNQEFPITEALFYAIRDKAGPIITTISLLYNLMQGPFTKKETRIAAEFKKMFGDGEDWLLSEIAYGFLIIVPKSYLKAQNMALNDLGLMVTGRCVAEDVPVVEEYYQSVKKASPGERFVDALLNNEIFDNNNQKSEWVIYIEGHGVYGKHIASIPLHRFAHMLDFFDKKIKMALLVYNACFAAGLNAELIYKELTLLGAKRSKEYSFPIVTQAVGDIATSTGIGEVLYFEQFITRFREVLERDNRSYEAAFNRFKENRGPWESSDISRKELEAVMKNYQDAYRQVLDPIMPYLRKFGRANDHGIEKRHKGDIPHIRFPYTAAWFPVVADQNVIIRISEAMAMTRTNSLLIGMGDAYKLLKAVLLDTDYVPFDLVIGELAWFHFIITMPGDVEVYVQRIENNHNQNFKQFLEFIGIELFEGCTERGHKVMHIKELILHEGHNKRVPILYRDVVIDFADKTAYYTDEHTKQYNMRIKQGERFVRAGEVEFGEYKGDYRVLYPDPLVTNESIREKVLKRQAMQQVEQALVKRISA